MQVSGIATILRRSATVALIGALFTPMAAAVSQDALPKVRLTQIVDPQWGYGSDALARLDRDAFLVILEFGADRRARVVYPESPKDSPFTPGATQVYAKLPSADAMFVRAARVTVPTLVAIASDLAPDLSTFTAEGRTWDFDYEIPRGTSRVEMVRALAAIMYGGEDMPYSFQLQALAPQLSNFAINALNSCGYIFGSEISPQFNNFLWQTFGPYPLGFFPGGGISPWFATMGGGSRFGLFPLGFRRYVDSGLWGQFGAGCQPLYRQRVFYTMYDPRTPGETPPDNGDQVAMAPLPKDRDPNARPPIVPDVGIELASPLDQSRRAGLAQDAADKLSGKSSGGLIATQSSELVQRTQVLEFIRRLSLEQQLGVNRSAVAQENAGPRTVRRSGGGSSGGYGGVRRTSAGGGSGSVGSSGSSGGSSGSVGSGSSSGGSSGRGGSAGGGRSGGGGRVPPI